MLLIAEVGTTSLIKRRDNLQILQKDKELFEKCENAVPRKELKPNENSVLCEKHFLPKDFKERRADSNSSRKRKKGDALQRRGLKADAVPSQWPGCPISLSKLPPSERKTLNATISARLENQALWDKFMTDKEREKDTFKSSEELGCWKKLKNSQKAKTNGQI